MATQNLPVAATYYIQAPEVVVNWFFLIQEILSIGKILRLVVLLTVKEKELHHEGKLVFFHHMFYMALLKINRINYEYLYQQI
jgi:hypothetical protein